MNVYLLIYLLVQMSMIAHWAIKTKYKDLIVWSIFVLLVATSSLRHESIGADTASYINFFRDMHNAYFGESVEGIEYGYVIFNQFLAVFFKEDQTIIFFTSVLILGGFFHFLLKMSRDVFFSILLFVSWGYFDYSLNLLRQFIAIVFVCNGLYYLINNKEKNFLILWIIAVFFHFSAVFFIVFYFIRKSKNQMITLIYLFILSGIIIALFPYALESILSFYPKYLSYLHSEYLAKIKLSGGYFYFLKLFMEILMMFVLFFLMNTKKKQSMYEKNYNFYMCLCMMIGAILNILAIDFGIIDRYSLYFSIFLCIIIPNLLEDIRNVYLKRILFCLIIIFSGVLHIYNTYGLQYKTFF